MNHDEPTSVHRGTRAVTIKMPGPDECIAFSLNTLDACCKDLEKIAKEKSEDHKWETVGYAMISIGLSSGLTEWALTIKREWLLTAAVFAVFTGCIVVALAYRLSARSKASVSLVLDRLLSARDACLVGVDPTPASDRSLESDGEPPLGWQLILDNERSDPPPPST